MAEDLIRIDIDEHVHGALFNEARRRHIMDETMDDIADEAAEWALGEVKKIYHRSFRNPTGYYESHVHVDTRHGSAVLTDGGHAGPVYGPWLEGVGSRNATTRFKGYHAFRIVTSMLEQRIRTIAEHRLRRTTDEL